MLVAWGGGERCSPRAMAGGFGNCLRVPMSADYPPDGEFQVVALGKGGQGRVVESGADHGFQPKSAACGRRASLHTGEKLVARKMAGTGSRARQPAGRDHGGGHAMQVSVGAPSGRRRASRRRAVLARIAIIRYDRRDTVRRSTAGSVDQDQKFHQIIIDRRAGRLHNKNILSSDILSDMYADFPFAKTPDKHFSLLDPYLLANFRAWRRRP